MWENPDQTTSAWKAVAAGVVLLVLAPTVFAETLLLTGNAGEAVVITNPARDWLSPSRARCAQKKLAGGTDADTAGDALGYRLFAGSKLERDDNELIAPLEIGADTASLTVRLGLLAVPETQVPLNIYFDSRHVGSVDLKGEAGQLLEREVSFDLTDADKARTFHLLRIVDDGKVQSQDAEGKTVTVVKSTERPIFVDWLAIDAKAVRLTSTMHELAAGDLRFVVRKSWQDDGSFRLFQVGRYISACIERRSYDRELFRKDRIRFPKNGYRQIGHTNDALHTIFTVRRDADGRQLENWAEMPQDWLGDHEASTQERGFRIVFDSPCAGRATLRMHREDSGMDCSMVVVVNGDVAGAKVGRGLETGGVPSRKALRPAGSSTSRLGRSPRSPTCRFVADATQSTSTMPAAVSSGQPRRTPAWLTGLTTLPAT